MGMSELEVIRRVELPLAVPTIMGGVRTAAINIVATATIAPLAGVLTLGDYIINLNVYGDEGVLAGAILVGAAGAHGRARPRRPSAPAHPAWAEASTQGAAGRLHRIRPKPRVATGRQTTREGGPR